MPHPIPWDWEGTSLPGPGVAERGTLLVSPLAAGKWRQRWPHSSAQSLTSKALAVEIISNSFLLPGSQLQWCILQLDSSGGVHLIVHISDYSKGSCNLRSLSGSVILGIIPGVIPQPIFLAFPTTLYELSYLCLMSYA